MNYQRFIKLLVSMVIFSLLIFLSASFLAESTYSQKSDTLDKEELKEFIQKEFEKAKKEIKEYTEINIKNTESWISFAKTVATILGVLIALVFGFQIIKSIQMDREYDRIIETRKDAQKIVQETTSDLDNIKKLLSSLVQSSVTEHAEKMKDIVKGEISQEVIKPFQKEAAKKTEIEEKLKNLEGQIRLLENLKADVTPDMHVQKALITLEHGNTHDAIKSLNAALEIDPRNRRAILNLVESYILNKEYTTALSLADVKSKFITKPQDIVILTQLEITARCLADLDYAERIKVLLEFLKANRDFDLPWSFSEMLKFLSTSDIDQKKSIFIFRLIKLLTRQISVEQFEQELELGI